MKGAATAKGKLQALLDTAQADKDYERSLELLSEIIAADPDAVEEKVMQAHLLALKGQISLAAYKETLVAIMQQLNMRPVPSLAAGNKLLRGIQYSDTGSSRIHLMEILLNSTERAIRETTESPEEFFVLKAKACLALSKYESFINTVEQLSRSRQPPKVTSALQRIAEKCQSTSFPDRNAHKVFGIGLSRTATSSLNLALKKLGYDSIHWLNPYTQSVVGKNDFPLFDGFTDISVSYQFEFLYQTFPNSHFIYTSRPEESWIRSVSSHYQNTRGISSPSELGQADIAQRFQGAAHAAEQNLYIRHNTWEAAFNHFQDRINTFFCDNQDARFLELRITEGEGWEKLCTFLHKEVPNTPFPNINKRAKSSHASE